MKVQIRFLDGEVMNGESDAATLQRMGFPVSFKGGNNQVAWVSLASIKYVLIKGGQFDEVGSEDPRNRQNLVKIVLHFVDGETLRSYKDETFSQEAEGFHMRVWDPESSALIRVLVSLHALKAIFFVNEWDSRSEEERLRFTPSPGAPSGAANDRADDEDASRRSTIQQQAQQQVES